MGHVRKVIQLLCEKILYARMSKCQFANTKLHYIAHVVGRVDPCKIETVKNILHSKILDNQVHFYGCVIISSVSYKDTVAL